MSHMFNQLSQQARSGPMPGPPPPPPQGHMANPHTQAMPLDRSGAGYMASSRKGHQGYAPSSREFPLKPGNALLACCNQATVSELFALQVWRKAPCLGHAAGDSACFLSIYCHVTSCIVTVGTCNEVFVLVACLLHKVCPHVCAGHLKAAQPSRLGMSATPPPSPAVPFHQIPASLQPPLLPSGAGPPKMGSRAPGMGDPTHQAAAAWAAASANGVQPAAAAQKPGKRALAIIDPESKQALSVLPSGASGSASDLIRTDSSSSSRAPHAEKPGRKLISIVDPNNKQPVQLPVKPLGVSRLIRTSSSASAASSDGSVPVKRTIAIVDPNNKQPVALPSSMLSGRQAPPTNVQAAQSSSGNSRRAKAPIAIMDPATASEVQLPARDTSIRSTGLPSASGQGQSRLTRARKPLAIVDPKTKAGPSSLVSSTAEAQAAAQQSSAPSLAGAPLADTVKLSCSVTDDMSVRCSLHVNAGCSQHSGLGPQGVAGDAVKLQLLLGVGDQVACHITPLSQLAGEFRSQGLF